MNSYFKVIRIFLITALFSLTGHAQDQTMNQNTIVESIQKLNSKNIFFGHQSVGKNIIDGINDILDDSPDTQLNLVVLDDNFSLPQSPGNLIHSQVGENEKPLSKCEDFNQIIRIHLATVIDVAMLKFCYIDINESTDVVALFDQYKQVMDGLVQDFPNISFIHVTTPLRHSEGGIGIWVRELIGKPNRSKLANIKRNEFNALLKEYYKNAAVFDLAESMSTTRDGTKNTFSYKGSNQYLHLVGEYTYDGGHLNENGRRKVAEDFLNYIASSI